MTKEIVNWKKEQRGRTNSRPYSPPADTMKEGIGRNSSLIPLADSSSAPTLRSSFRSLRWRSSRSDMPLSASYSAGITLPTSVVRGSLVSTT